MGAGRNMAGREALFDARSLLRRRELLGMKAGRKAKAAVPGSTWDDVVAENARLNADGGAVKNKVLLSKRDALKDIASDPMEARRHGVQFAGARPTSKDIMHWAYNHTQKV